MAAMAERPEDLNLPNAVITRIIKEAVSSWTDGWARGGRTGNGGDRSWARSFAHPRSSRSSRMVSTSPRRPGAPSPAPPASSCSTPHPGEAGRASQTLAVWAVTEGKREETPCARVCGF